MGNSIWQKSVLCSLFIKYASLVERGFFNIENRDSFVRSVLECVRDNMKKESSAKIGRTLETVSFIMLDEIGSKIRYILKTGRKEALEKLHEIGKNEISEVQNYNYSIETYGLALRRARRMRQILWETQNGVEGFFVENPYDALRQAVIYGARNLAHIDIIISLYEEEIRFCCNLPASQETVK